MANRRTFELEIVHRLAQYDRCGVINRCKVRPKPSFGRTHSGGPAYVPAIL